ncbi:MAG: MFS transporter [Myxococcales bacterium]|nr:MFS transporter [Myxococcales bacterium]
MPSRRLLLLLAVSAAVSVSNLYYAQPLAAEMAASLRADARAIGAALVATQAGYALGMLLLVPLGDGRERRSAIVVTIAASVPFLLLVATARSVPALTAASLLVGLTSSVPQMIIPYGVGLAAPAERGRIVGAIMSGLLTGVLLSRTASGTFATVIGWRGVYVAAAVLMALLGLVLRVALPRQEPETRMAWPAILRSLASLLLRTPELRRRAIVGACGFASFSVFWSMLSFHLAVLGRGSVAAGLFGVLGVAGILVAPVAGRLATRVRPSLLNGTALALAATSFLLFALGARSLRAIGAGVVLLDAGCQASHLTNQTVLFGLAPELRSRFNALYMVAYFAGGGAGTAAAAFAWKAGGWSAVCATGAAFALLGIAALALPSARAPIAPARSGAAQVPRPGGVARG